MKVPRDTSQDAASQTGQWYFHSWLSPYPQTGISRTKQMFIPGLSQFDYYL